MAERVRDDKELPTAAVADVKNEVACDLRLLSAALASEYTLLNSLERLLRAEEPAVEATDSMLDTLEATDASMEDAAAPSEEVMDA